MIETGETTRTTTLMVTDDDLPDGGTGTNRGETLVLFGSVDGVEIGDLTFIIWDAAVPALPVGGALLLGALLRRGAGAWTGQIARTLNHAPPAGSASGRRRRDGGLHPARNVGRQVYVPADVALANRFTPPPDGGPLVLRTCTVPAKPRWLLAIRGPRQCCPSPVRSHRAA